MIDEGLEMRQEKRQSSTIRKRIRRLYRQMRFKFWLAEQDYIHYNVGIHEGPPPSSYFWKSTKESRREKQEILEAIDRLIKEDRIRGDK